jgi:hypothetical protein
LRILGIENRKPNIFFLSFPTGNYLKKYNFFLSIRATFVRTHLLVRIGRARGYEGIWGGGRGAGRFGRAYVRADRLWSARTRARPRRRIGVSTRTRSCLYKRELVRARFSLGNFITDTTVRLSHRRPSGRRPSARPSVCYHPHDNPGNGAEREDIMTSPMHLKYSTNMRGVDMADQLRASYNTQKRMHKW